MTRVLVYGAGVIGQIYAGRLMQSGHDVTLLARGHAVQELTERGVSLRMDGASCRSHPLVIREVPGDAAWDVVLVTVRRDQIDEAVEGVAKLSAGRVVFMLNHSLDLDRLRERVGADRTIFAFPGVGGYRTDDATIDYLEIPQQHTTVGRSGGIEKRVVELLRSAGFAVDTSADMAAWLKTHLVFVTALGAAILGSGADSAALAADRPRVADAVAAIGEGFRALARNGLAVTPTPLRLLFTVVPRWIAVRYWRSLLRGPVGTVTITPHVRASRDTEFPVLCADVRRLVAGDTPRPHLDRLLDAATGPAAGPRDGSDLKAPGSQMPLPADIA